MANVTFRASGSNQITGTTINQPIPAGAVVGDVALAIWATGANNTTFTLPSGWVQLGTTSVTNSMSVLVARKVVASGDPGATLNWLQSGGGKHVVSIVVYSNVDTVTPVGGFAQLPYTTTGTTRAAPALASTGLAIQAAATKGTDPGNWTVPTGFTSRATIAQTASGAVTAAWADSSTALTGGDVWTSLSEPQASTFALWLNAAAPATPVPGTVNHSWSGSPTSTGFLVNAYLSGATSVRLAVSASADMSSPTFLSAQTPDAAGRVAFSVTGRPVDARTYYRLYDTPSGGSETAIGSVGWQNTLQTAGTPFTGTRKIVIGGCFRTAETDAIALQDGMDYDPHYGVGNGDFSYAGSASSLTATQAAVWLNQLQAVPKIREFVSKGLMSFYCVSDHDCGNVDNGDSNNAYTAANIVAYKQVIPARLNDPQTTTTARDQIWNDGRVSFFMLDIRNTDRTSGSATDNAAKTMLGAAQLARLKTWLSTNPAPFKVIISDVPWMGAPDVTAKPDAWWSYSTERADISAYIAASAIGHVEIWHGDSHLIGYATPTKNTWGNVPVLCAAGWNQTGGGRNTSTFSAFWNNSGGEVRQYGRVTFTDSGGLITRTFTGWDATGNVSRVTDTTIVDTNSAGTTNLSVIVGGVKHGAVRYVVVGGAKKSVTGVWIIKGGVKKAVT